MSCVIRPASPSDLSRIVAIYNQEVAHSLAVFTESPTTEAERGKWLQTRRAAGFPVLVCEHTGDVRGFASFGEFRAWPGYRFTVEHSIYVHPDYQRSGLGTQLMQGLFAAAVASGKHVMVAAIEASNVGSLRFHQRLGFEHAGTLREVGHKFGQFLDLSFLCKTL